VQRYPPSLSMALDLFAFDVACQMPQATSWANFRRICFFFCFAVSCAYCIRCRDHDLEVESQRSGDCKNGLEAQVAAGRQGFLKSVACPSQLGRQLVFRYRAACHRCSPRSTRTPWALSANPNSGSVVASCQRAASDVLGCMGLFSQTHASSRN